MLQLPRNKPIDRWLGLAGIAMGIALYLLPKTPNVVLFSLALIFALLIHPIWNFWWIEAKLSRKLGASALLVMVLLGLGQLSWPQDSGSLLQAVTRPFVDFWGWLTGPHGRWFDRFVGAAIITAIWMLAKRCLLGISRIGARNQNQKGGFWTIN
jgi:hypothetical protein